MLFCFEIRTFGAILSICSLYISFFFYRNSTNMNSFITSIFIYALPTVEFHDGARWVTPVSGMGKYYKLAPFWFGSWCSLETTRWRVSLKSTLMGKLVVCLRRLGNRSVCLNRRTELECGSMDHCARMLTS